MAIMKESTYHHRDILKIFPDLSPRSLVSWAEKDILIPSIEDARGRGTVRRYSFDNIIQAGIIRELMALGVTFRIIKNFFTGELKKEIKKLDYDCVMMFQWKLSKAENHDNADQFKILRHPDVRIIPTKEFENFKANEIFCLIGSERDTGRSIPMDEDLSMLSTLVVNISRIQRYVVTELTSREKV